MSARSRTLRTQLSLAMIFVALTSLGVFITGMIAFYMRLGSSWQSGLSEVNRDTLQTLVDGGTVSPDALTTLVGAFSLSWGGGFARAEIASLAILIVLATLVAVIGGILVARKLSAPIESVTRAALKIADGNLDAEIPETAGSAAETEDLVAAFRTMAGGLEQAERDAIESSAAIAHELRTPLTILRGRLQGLGDGAFSPSREMTDGLIAQVDTLSRIVDELGLLSRLSSGRFELQIIEIELADEVNRVITAMRPDLEQLGIALETSLTPVRLLADPARVRQALAALIDNARRYAAAGGYLRISCFANGRYACIAVRDHGPGITPAERERVFDRWWRGDKSRNRAEGGTGLGLAIVRAIAQAHGGDTAVTGAARQKGAEFTLRLPRHQAGGPVKDMPR
ncbi:sensor histidine kinase [Paracoccus xiamenensis]|uniref:sensor histidine kinase n=1 Tax=Paracoccus xiamenensis TaxID=2714901 RepID=UPI00140BED8F|nr:HAMP domain-containing sensor histidine kinase [Paracoccus xiamenensis]NHF74511.1 HAMP domain-containing histidine kinase [Paracoccus xiamenensis]